MSVVQNVKIFKNKPLKTSNREGRARCAGAGSSFDAEHKRKLCTTSLENVEQNNRKKNDRCNVTFLTVYLHLNIVKTFLFHPNCSLTERVNHHLTTHISPRKLLLLRAI